MGFDPLNSGDYHKFESTSGSSSGGGKSTGSGDKPRATRFNGQEIAGLVFLGVLILVGVILVGGFIINLLTYL